jgi:hypothetical protein
VVPGRLYGLRAWTVGGAGKRLESLAQRRAWARGSRSTTARCAVGRGHSAPASNCGCGLYALHPTASQCQSSFDQARRAARTGEPGAEVFGIVAAWGEVEVHESGFRAEHARPHALLLPGGRSDHYARRVRALAAGHDAEVWRSSPDTICTAAASSRTLVSARPPSESCLVPTCAASGAAIACGVGERPWWTSVPC